MPIVSLAGSPLAPTRRPIDVFVRDFHADAPDLPLLILHGGWGYEFYPFAPQIDALAERRVIAPDRTGYGKSSRITALPPRFHLAAAAEHEATLDALGIERCAIWGHSDGAVIALLMALRRPARVAGVIVEAVHLDRGKPRSRQFFTDMLEAPERFGPRVTARLAADHGDPDWRAVLHAGGRAWLDIAATPDDDFYDHRLGELACPVLAIHGVDDPRTEPGELDRLAREAPNARVRWIAGAGHAPHSERAASAEVTAVGASFLRGL
ncbi:MAG TPA: alpha/beta fold hydrolase [Kofleriaceae bacterium]|nr:alpha/beta fold hydrolase [Kofleriaceae bacterium]